MIVELSAPTTMLAALDPAAHPAWARWLRRAQHQLATLPDHDAQLGGTHHPATSIADARHRHPGASLGRFLRVRDRHCVGPLCDRTAHSAEIDHTVDWADDGVTVAANLGPLCAHCHRLKHEGGWELAQPEPGRFVWRSPLGATHVVERRRVLEPTRAPMPRPDGRPRSVRGVRRPPRPGHTGWVDRPIRFLRADEIPGPAHPVADPPPDDPPF